MTIARELVTAAYRRARVIDRRRALNAQEATIGLQMLQAMLHEWIASGTFGRMTDAGLEGDLTAGENVRIIIRTVDAVTITLPEEIDDPAYAMPANGYSSNRPPRDGAIIAISDLHSDFKETYIHDAGNGGWVKIEGLTLDSEVPLTPRYREAFEANLAVRIADENSQEPSRTLQRAAVSGKASLSGRGDGALEPIKPDYF